MGQWDKTKMDGMHNWKSWRMVLQRTWRGVLLLIAIPFWRWKLYEYLHRIGKEQSSECPYGDSWLDDARHSFFECGMWVKERRVHEMSVGSVSPANVISKMLKDKDSCNHVLYLVGTDLRRNKLEHDSKRRNKKIKARVVCRHRK